ncbi:MAG: hypothetical protein WD069_14070 [Planctomycetales bacterium]
MRCLTPLGAALVAGGMVAAASGADLDLAQIERKVAQEPEYASGQPKYCLLVFGPTAETRVWLVSDGKDVLYVDRDGDGDLTGEGEQVKLVRRRGFLEWLIGSDGDQTLRAGTIAEKDGKTEHKDLTLSPFGDEGDYYSVSVNVQDRGPQYTWLTFADKVQDAPIVHFNGPLTLRSVDRDLVADDGEAELYVELGTPGLGENTFVATSYRSVPGTVHPVAEVEFPVAEGDPVRRKFVLKQRC